MMGSYSPTEQDMANLRWMRKVNSRGVGLFGSTVRRLGALPELAPLVNEGLARLVSGQGPKEKCGYWILPNGTKALTEFESRQLAADQFLQVAAAVNAAAV